MTVSAQRPRTSLCCAVPCRGGARLSLFRALALACLSSPFRLPFNLYHQIRRVILQTLSPPSLLQAVWNRMVSHSNPPPLGLGFLFDGIALQSLVPRASRSAALLKSRSRKTCRGGCTLQRLRWNWRSKTGAAQSMCHVDTRPAPAHRARSMLMCVCAGAPHVWHALRVGAGLGSESREGWLRTWER